MLSKYILKKRTIKKNKKPYSLRTTPQRYGPGTNVCVINDMKSVNNSSYIRTSLQDLLMNNAEFTQKKGFYKYFKILEVRATFLPANITGAFNNIVANMSWVLTTTSLSDLQKDDSSKMLSAFRTRNITLRFLPPRTVLDVQSITENPNKFFDFSQFLSTDLVVNVPGWLFVFNPTTSLLYFNFEAVVLFRGNDFNSNSSKIIEKEDNPFKDKIFFVDPEQKEDIIEKDIPEDPPDEDKKQEIIKPIVQDDQIAFEIQKLELKLQKMKESFKPTMSIFKIPDKPNEKEKKDKDQNLVNLFKDDDNISNKRKPKGD